jgi:DNA-binding GntR family transcriptional regulator
MNLAARYARRNPMPNAETSEGEGSLVVVTARRIREGLIAGDLPPGRKLSEAGLAAQLGVSRNTLREVFRLLTSQRLLTYIPNRGVFVAAPQEAAVIDIYRVRMVIQKGAIAATSPGHPALARMREISNRSQEAGKKGNWTLVGTLNLEFHRAMVELCESERLSACFELVLAELRLVFGQVEDTAHLHAPFIELNAALLSALETGQLAEASAQLDSYLIKSERSVLAVMSRIRR